MIATRCKFCGRSFKNAKYCKTHFRNLHASASKSTSRDIKACPIEGCGYANLKPSRMAKHFKETHECKELLDGGVDVHKVRKSTLTDYERGQIAEWLLARGLVKAKASIPKFKRTGICNSKSYKKKMRKEQQK